MTTWRTPQEVVNKGIEAVLDGNPPVGRAQQILLMNAVAAQIEAPSSEPACLVIKILFPDYFEAVTEAEVSEIALGQAMG